MTTLDDLPDTGQLAAIGRHAYGLDESAARRDLAAAVLERDLEHRDQLELFRLQVEVIWLRWPGQHAEDGYQPHPVGARLALQLLEQYGAAWAATDARHAAALEAATRKLDSLERP